MSWQRPSLGMFATIIHRGNTKATIYSYFLGSVVTQNGTPGLSFLRGMLLFIVYIYSKLVLLNILVRGTLVAQHNLP